MATTPRPTVNAELLVHWTSYYTQAAEKLVRHYRDMADRLERELRPDDKASMSGTPRYSHAVEGALEALVWDQANAHAAHLVGAAARADAAEAAVAAEQATHDVAEVLAPFVAYYEAMSPTVRDGEDDDRVGVTTITDTRRGNTMITVGDLRRAAALLTQPASQPESESP